MGETNINYGMRKVNVTGRVYNGKMYIHDKVELAEYCRQNEGERVMVMVETIGNEPSSAFIGLYRGKVLKDIQQGFYNLGDRRSTEYLDAMLRRSWPMITQNDEGEDKEVEQMNTYELNGFMEFVKQYAAENLGVIVDV